MSVGEDDETARGRRIRARRALAEADAAATRLHVARRRAEELLRRTAGELPPPAAPSEEDAPQSVVTPEVALRARMRRIEDRMQAADSRMRTVEVEVTRTGERMSNARSEREP